MAYGGRFFNVPSKNIIRIISIERDRGIGISYKKENNQPTYIMFSIANLGKDNLAECSSKEFIDAIFNNSINSCKKEPVNDFIKSFIRDNTKIVNANGKRYYYLKLADNHVILYSLYNDEKVIKIDTNYVRDSDIMAIISTKN